jgi:hypothetical protein
MIFLTQINGIVYYCALDPVFEVEVAEMGSSRLFITSCAVKPAFADAGFRG